MKTELGFSVRAPEVSRAEVDMLCALLHGRGWMRAADIAALIDIDDRKVRAIAEASDGQIISGQAGYRLFDRTTPLGDADASASWLESQGKKMLMRAAAIRRRYHLYAREGGAAA